MRHYILGVPRAADRMTCVLCVGDLVWPFVRLRILVTILTKAQVDTHSPYVPATDAPRCRHPPPTSTNVLAPPRGKGAASPCRQPAAMTCTPPTLPAPQTGVCESPHLLGKAPPAA